MKNLMKKAIIQTIRCDLNFFWWLSLVFFQKGRSEAKYIDKILAFYNHLLPFVDIFYLMNVDKKWTFLYSVSRLDEPPGNFGQNDKHNPWI